MQDIIAKCRGSVSKILRKEKSDNTLSTKVERKHLPRDGFATLNDIITTKLKWIDSMMNVRPENVTKALYDSVISIIISGHYCRLPTGRPRAFSFLRLDQMDDFRGKGLAVSEFFKTNTKFGYQVILTDERLLQATEIYLNTFRPIAVRHAKKSRLESNSEWLWLTFEGNQHRLIGSYVTKLFAIYDYHITTCDLRSLAETRSNNAMLGGTITPAQKDAITDLNGHSSQVTRDYYLKTDRLAQSKAGRQGFAQMIGLPVDQGKQDELLHWPDEDTPNVPIYGVAHPDKDNPITKRARWTHEEVNFIGEWIKRYLGENPHATRVLSKLLHHIWKTPSCHPIFHPRHVLTTTRLKSGLSAYEKEHGAITLR
jgi:hypothetical protein